VTLIASPEVESLGPWLEQLLAESTGKKGKGLIPVAGEAVGEPQAYQRDRQFFYLRYSNTKDTALDSKVAALIEAGFPVMRIELLDLYSVAQEFFRWEFATAVAGSIIGINPFDQPDVEASKIETRRLTEQVERTGELPTERPVFEFDGIELFADPRTAEQLRGKGNSLLETVQTYLETLQGQEYFAILAYLERSPEHERLLDKIRLKVRDRKRVATCLGFGPRFLHSTGQAYKGGPNTGVFLELTAESENGPAVPQRKYGFGTVQAAQARGDFAVLMQRERRVLRIHFRKNVNSKLEELGSKL
jgi:transaldolase/glucose-6-phosphate isomerase